MFAALIGAAALMGSANAHIALWDNSMFGLNYPYQSSDTANTQWNQNAPVTPLRESDALTEAEWFAHGYTGYPPNDGEFMSLPSGGVYHGEVECNRAGTTLRNPTITDALDTYACPGDSGVGALHVMNRYNETVDDKWFGGTALAIAYTSDETTLRPNDLTVISVVQNSVWFRQIDYAIPSGMPPCPSGGCLCTWNWIHEANHGEGYPFEIYNLLYRCNVTGSTNSANTVKRGAVPVDCTGSPSSCVTGPKTPMYLYQADGNNLPHLDVPPSYNANWGFADGAQTDIFTAAATPAPTTYLANGYATGTATASASQATATSIPSTWSALGCMVDEGTERTLPNGAYYDRENNTISECVSYCDGLGYTYAGVEYGVECWCSNTATLQLTNATDCNVPCPGDSFAKCGGSYRIDVFMSSYTPTEASSGTTTTAAAAAYPTQSLQSGWSSLGCSYDDPNNRALNRGATVSTTNNTVPNCIASCASQGFSYAGLEYGQECWCGTTANYTAAGSGCNVPCTGDSSTMCGGSYRINIYTNSQSKSTTSKSSTTSKVAAISSTSTSKTTTSAKPTSSSSKASTTTTSTAKTPTSSSTSVSSSASASGSKSTSKSSSSSKATSTVTSTTKTTTTAKSTSSSSSKASTITAKPSTSTTSSSSKTSTSTTTAKSSSTTSSVRSTSTSKASSSTKLTSSISTSKTSTKPSTTSTTTSTTTKTAATVPVITTTKAATTSSTTTKASSTTTSTFSSASATPTAVIPSGWTNLGCNVDSKPRALNGSYSINNNVTATWCINYCSSKGYAYAGTEYSTQCFCGNTFTKNLATSGCTAKCAGNSTEICGGSYRINVYGKSSAVASTTKVRRRGPKREVGRL